MKFRSCLLILFLAVCENTFAEKKPNVVVITIDTLRADRLGCYGYKKARTPNIDGVAAQAVQFTNAVSHVPLTRPSHISMFTGLYPYQHKVHDNVAPALDSKIATLAEVLKKQNYVTSAFVSSFVVNSQSGLQRGFDTYSDNFDPGKQPTQFALNLEKRAGDVLQEFTTWHRKASKQDKPYFSWIHFYDPHFPYEPPAPYSTAFADRPYDGEVAYTDEIVGKLLKLLGPQTLLILTSDHGESLGEHGENAHSFFIYDSTLQVPLLIRWPQNLKPAKLTIQVRLIDLFPTILDLLGISPPKNSGISLKPWLTGSNNVDPKLPSYCETFTPWLHFGWSRLQGIRMGGWKYIEAPQAELYDLNRDPAELSNVIKSHASKRQQLKQWLLKSGALSTGAPAKPADMDPETLEKLASLGYAGISSPSPHSKNLPDPKSKLEDFKLFNKLIREGVEDFQQQRYEQAASRFQQLRDKNIPSFEVHYYLGRSLLRLKSYDKARTELDTAAKKLPHFLPVYRDLSEAWEGLGNPKEAEKALLAGLAISPDHPLLVQELAWFYQQRKNYAAAEQLLLRELKQHPEDHQSRFRLGAIYRDTGKPDAAIAQFQMLIKARPDDAEAHNQLGMLYGGTNRLQEAVREFELALKHDPESRHIRENLKLAKSRQGSTQKIRFQIIQTQTAIVAQSILRKLKNGADWSTLSKDYSLHSSARSGAPYIEASTTEIDPVLAKALSELKPGQISEVIHLPTGFYILRRES